MSDYTTISVRKRDKQVFEQALDHVAEQVGEEITHSDALRELAESYIGKDEPQKYVSASATRPSTWHLDPNCANVGGKGVLKPCDDVPDIATGCVHCADGLTPNDILSLGDSDGN